MESMQRWFLPHWNISNCCHLRGHFSAIREFHRGNGSLCKGCYDRAAAGNIAGGHVKGSGSLLSSS
jgi:hypothetical protein